MAMHPHRVGKKTLRLDPDKLARLQKLFQTTSESKAIRQAIDETLACNEALQAARRIQKRDTFARDLDQTGCHRCSSSIVPSSFRGCAHCTTMHS
jgi:hypothetical protein